MADSGRIILNEEDVDYLLERVLATTLTDGDKAILIGIIRIYQQLQFALSEAKLSIKRLRNVFGFSTEKRKHLSPRAGTAEDSDKNNSLGAKVCEQLGSMFSQAFESLKQATNYRKNGKRKGHGRLGHKAYTGADIVNQDHEYLKPGDACPEDCGGRLYAIKPKPTVCLTGHAVATARKYLQQRLRCALCGEIFTAKAPASMPTQKYDAALKAHVAIAKNYAGMPWYRLQMLQQMVGVPLPHTTQWQLTESLANDISPIYYELERLAAQGKLISHDDTYVRIMSLMRENQKMREDGVNGRTGMYTTAIVSQLEAFIIYLFISGRCHSGENMAKLLEQRFPGLAPVIRMADALSANTSGLPAEFIDIICKCLLHGRRKFYEIYDYFPGECRVVIDVLALVYHNDEKTKQDKMSPDERLAYHQLHSAPIMEALREWLVQKLNGHEVEPNSSLGKSMKYMLRHWDGLTRFLHVPGAMLDNNITERALKTPIRARKNSLFYQTEHGAQVGSILTSIIHTCVMNKINPADYLIALQHNQAALRENPGDWLPWNYQVTLQRLRSSPLLAA